MDQFVQKRLSECLGFPIPEEMIEYILTLKDSHEIEEYFGSLLDFGITEHCLFINDFKQRLTKKNLSKIENTVKNNTSNPKKNPLVIGKPQNKKNDKYEQKQKIPTEGKTTNVPTANQPSNASESVQSSSVRKKTKYVNLYSQDGQMKDVILLKGRHLCNCQATRHKLINNCMQCGRIVCEQENSGPCLFCGTLVCSDDEMKLIDSSTKKGDNLKKTLLQQRPKGWEEALEMRNRLLEYDRTSEKRTIVIDDESDYFTSNSVWLSEEERRKLKRMEAEILERKHASRLANNKFTIDFTGRQIIEDDSQSTIVGLENEILKEISDSKTFTSQNSHLIGLNAMKNNASINTAVDDEDDGLVHPLFDGPAPIFDESIIPQQYSGGGTGASGYDGVYNRVQDKELLEISDLRNCLSMHQPWASLLVAGIKKHEGRSWYTSHRGRLWIAATAKPVSREEIKIMENFYTNHYNDDRIIFPSQYPNACLLGCVLVQDCLPQEEYRKQYPDGESDSPYVFICSDAQELPIRFPIRGQHKIYKIDPNIHTAAVKSMQRLAKSKNEQ